MQKQWICFWLSIAVAALAVGCADTATCDPNEILYAGNCMSVPMQEPEEASVDEVAVENTADAGAAEGGDSSDEH